MADRRIPSHTLSPIGAVFGIAVMVFVPRQVWGCSCTFRTDKTMYCEADFVLRARVVDRTVLYGPDGDISDMYRHRIDNSKTLRSRISTSITDDIRYVETATDDGRCGMQLDNGRTYVFGVLRAKILDTRTLTRSGFAHTYRHRVENQLVLWSNNNYNAVPRIQFVETATESSLCGAGLENGATYILGGYKENVDDAINVSICGLIIDWDRLTQPQRDDYENNYPLSCAG